MFEKTFTNILEGTLRNTIIQKERHFLLLFTSRDRSGGVCKVVLIDIPSWKVTYSLPSQCWSWSFIFATSGYFSSLKGMFLLWWTFFVNWIAQEVGRTFPGAFNVRTHVNVLGAWHFAFIGVLQDVPNEKQKARSGMFGLQDMLLQQSSTLYVFCMSFGREK